MTVTRDRGTTKRVGTKGVHSGSWDMGLNIHQRFADKAAASGHARRLNNKVLPGIYLTFTILFGKKCIVQNCQMKCSRVDLHGRTDVSLTVGIGLCMYVYCGVSPISLTVDLLTRTMDSVWYDTRCG